MKYIFILSGVVCLSFMLLPACAPQAEEQAEPEPEAAPEPVFDQAAEEAAVRNLLAQFETVYNNHDEKALAALWTDTAIQFRSETKGKEAIEELIKGIFERHKRSIKYNFLEELGFSFLTPEVVLIRQRVQFTDRYDTDGNPAPNNTELAAILAVKKDGNWRIAAILEMPIDE